MRIPTTNQIKHLNAIKAGRVAFHYDNSPIWNTQTTTRKDTAPLIKNGWATDTLNPNDEHIITLTPHGTEALTIADAIEFCNSIRLDVLTGIADITRRTSGGLNIQCRECRNHDGHPDIVWFTNEKGTTARKDAEQQLAVHRAQHIKSGGPVRIMASLKPRN